jgi:hypothetical protein
MSSYKHVSNSQWVWRYSCLKLARTNLTTLDFCLWGWMKSEVYKEKANTRDELVARIMNSVALRSLSYDRSAASSKASSSQSAIYCFLFRVHEGYPVAAYVFFFVFSSPLPIALSCLPSRDLEESSYTRCDQFS